MSEAIVRRRSPDASQDDKNDYRPDELNAELAAASLAKDLVAKLPTPAIDTRKFTIIHGLMKSLNHRETTFESDGKTVKLLGNYTYVDTSIPSELMDRVSEKSVNVDGKYLNLLFAYLMKPKYIIQGMPQNPQEEQKPGLLTRIWGGITGRGSSQEAKAQ